MSGSVPNSPPGISPSPPYTVWTPEQWIAAWQSKADAAGGPFLPLVGGTLTGGLDVSGPISGGSIATGSDIGPTWTTGLGAPTATAPIGSLYSQADGTVGATLYVSQGGGVWAAVAGV